MSAAKSLGYYQGGAATAKTLADVIATDVPEAADYAVVQAYTQACRYRYDGDAPTASVGRVLAAGDSITVAKGQFADFKIIQAAATAEVNVEFFKTD